MPDSIIGDQGGTLLTAIIIVAVALLALVGVFWLIRARASATFIRGGKNRLPRLAVLDATAVDTRRRLVLIRRDDVEHLIMIGGPTDIVIESRIAPQGNQAAIAQPRQPEQRPLHPAPPQRQSSPDVPQAPASKQERPGERAPQPARPGAVQPSQPNTPMAPAAPRPAMSAPAAKAAVAGTAGSIRNEAADVLDSARTRVFEEPSFDESSFDDLTAVPPPAASTKTTIPVATPRPPAPASPVSATATEPARANVALRTEAAADLLETARTRVFEDTDFDETAQASAPIAQARPSTGAASPALARAPISASAPAGPNFEAVLAAELSDDLTLDETDDSFFTEPYYEHQLNPEEAELIDAPEVKPESQASRDSLEEEMERLLGDLSRKP